MQFTHKNDTYIRDFKWSPDSKKIVYMDRKNRVNLLDVASGKVSLLYQSRFENATAVAKKCRAKACTFLYWRGSAIVYMGGIGVPLRQTLQIGQDHT